MRLGRLASGSLPAGVALGIGLLGQSRCMPPVLAFRVRIAHQLRNGRRVSDTRLFGQNGHEAFRHQVAEFGSVLHGGCGGCMFVENLIAPTMADKKRSIPSGPSEFEVLIDMLLSNQAMLLTLLSREAKRIADTGSMTMQEAQAFLIKETAGAKGALLEGLEQIPAQWADEMKGGR